jgi:hypothetical protein
VMVSEIVLQQDLDRGWHLGSCFLCCSLVEVRDGGYFDGWLKGKVNWCVCVLVFTIAIVNSESCDGE